jgi:hypothetical protein
MSHIVGRQYLCRTNVYKILLTTIKKNSVRYTKLHLWLHFIVAVLPNLCRHSRKMLKNKTPFHRGFTFQYCFGRLFVLKGKIHTVLAETSLRLCLHFAENRWTYVTTPR